MPPPRRGRRRCAGSPCSGTRGVLSAARQPRSGWRRTGNRRYGASRYDTAMRFLMLALALVAGTAWSQPYPAKPVRIVVGFAPGGGTDIVSRLLAQKLGERWSQPVVVENKLG